MPDNFTEEPARWIGDRSHALELLTAYLTPGLFTGSLWDPAIERRATPDSWNLIDVEDLYSPTLLSAPIRASAGQAIIERADAIGTHLRGIDPEVSLWHPDSHKVDDALCCAERLTRELKRIPHIGPTKASKLIAAKRPALIPIWDSQVCLALGAGRMSWRQYWMAWRRTLTTEVVEQLRHLATEAGRGSLSPLRTIDIIIWMDTWGWKSLSTSEWESLRCRCEARTTS